MKNDGLLKNLLSQPLYEEIVRTTQRSVFALEEGISDKVFLITGANGFIAYYLVLTILNANDDLNRNNRVVLLVRNAERAEKRFGKILARDDVSLLIQDVCDPILGIDRADYIVHAASAADAQHFNSDPIGVFNSNVIGTENVIRLAQQCQCTSLVFISSFTVYGQGTDKVQYVDESFCGVAPWDYNGACYPYGKRSAEFLCMTEAKKSGLPVKIIRPGFVYGASHQEDNRVYSEIIRCVSEDRPITLQSAGLLYRSMVYVTDVVTAVLATLIHGVNGEAYNVAKEHISIREFALKAAEAAQSANVFVQFANEEDRMVDCSRNVFGAITTQKIEEECGWKACVELKDGILSAAQILSEK